MAQRGERKSRYPRERDGCRPNGVQAVRTGSGTALPHRPARAHLLPLSNRPTATIDRDALARFRRCEASRFVDGGFGAIAALQVIDCFRPAENGLHLRISRVSICVRCLIKTLGVVELPGSVLSQRKPIGVSIFGRRQQLAPRDSSRAHPAQVGSFAQSPAVSSRPDPHVQVHRRSS